MAKAFPIAATIQVTPIVRVIIVAGDSIVIGTETATNGVAENMNGVVHITSRGLMCIRIMETISTVRARTTTVTRTEYLPDRTMRAVAKVTIPNARTFISTREEVSCQSLAIQTLSAPLIVMVSGVVMKKATGIGRRISSVIVSSDNRIQLQLFQTDGGLRAGPPFLC